MENKWEIEGEWQREKETPEEKWPDSVSLCYVAEDSVALKGMVLFHVNVGSLPLYKAEKYLSRLQSSYMEVLNRMPKDYAVLWVPNREKTFTEVVKFDR